MVKMASKALARKIIKIALAKKAENIVLLDLKKLSSMTDYFLVCSAGSGGHSWPALARSGARP